MLTSEYSGQRDLVGVLLQRFKKHVPFTPMEGRFRHLPLIEEVGVKDSPPPGSDINGVQATGTIWGWAFAGDEPVEVDILIDGRLAGSTAANIFRLDLLQQGFGVGRHAFEFRPADTFLDGREHKITVRLKGSDTLKSEKTARLPFHFNPERPWLSSKPTTESSDQAKIADATNHFIRTGDASAVISLVEENPSLVFRDLGFEERFRREKVTPPIFSDYLNSRWHRIEGRPRCKPGCCKDKDLGAFSIERLDECTWKERHFASKTVVKEYGERFGAMSPSTLFDNVSAAEFINLPLPKRYVLKPKQDSGRATFLMHDDLNLFDGFRYSRSEISDTMRQYNQARPHSKFMIEEFVCQEGTDEKIPIVPLDYKLHSFGGKARIIQVDDRNTISRDALHRSQSWLSRDWVEAHFRMRKNEQQNDPISQPKCFERMLSLADQIATDIGDYVRVDFYASDAGPVLGEITTYSHGGVGFTEYGQKILAQAWALFGGGAVS